MLKHIVDRISEDKLSNVENLQVEYKGYTIYDTLPKSVRASGDFEIIDKFGAVIGYAGDIDQAKSIIDELVNSSTSVDDTEELNNLYYSKINYSPYFIYKYYKNDDSRSRYYGKPSPKYYWSEVKKDFVTDLSSATFYRLRSEADRSLKRKRVSPSPDKYCYLILDLRDNPEMWKKRFINFKR